jgi:hypothetical protein
MIPASIFKRTLGTFIARLAFTELESRYFFLGCGIVPAPCEWIVSLVYSLAS